MLLDRNEEVMSVRDHLSISRIEWKWNICKELCVLFRADLDNGFSHVSVVVQYIAVTVPLIE